MIIDYINNFIDSVVIYMVENYSVKQEDIAVAVFTTIISVLVTILTVFVTNLITIWLNNKNLKKSQIQFEESLSEQKLQFEENLQLQKDMFIQNIKNDNEKNRISIMPYFVMENEGEIQIGKENIIIPIYFNNIGNGTAIKVKFEKDDLIVHKSKASGMEYKQSGGMSKDLAKVADKIECAIECPINEKAQNVILYISFEDMMRREYIQEFVFWYDLSRDRKIYIQHSYSPECQRDYEYDDNVS